MAIVTRKEFAEMCGDDVKILNVNISRNKIVFADADRKRIDTENMINMLYKKKRVEINKSKKEDAKLLASIPLNPRKGKPSVDDFDKEDGLPPSLDIDLITQALKPNSTSGGDNMQDWIKKKIKGDAELVTVRVEKEKLMLSRAAGESLPIKIALNAHTVYMRNIITSFESGIEKIANKFCGIMAGGDIIMYTKILEECRKELDRCVRDAGGETNRELELMIREFNKNPKT